MTEVYGRYNMVNLTFLFTSRLDAVMCLCCLFPAPYIICSLSSKPQPLGLEGTEHTDYTVKL